MSLRALFAKIRDRYAAWLLVAGAVGAALAFIPHLPRERHVDVRLDDALSVTGVDMAWLPISASSGRGEAVQGSAWHFTAGKAPAALDTRVSLPDGKYELDVLVERGAEREVIHRTIAIGDSDRITVRLR